MMKRLSLSFLTILLTLTLANAQEKAAKPKLVVGIVVDQMRWDYLYRFKDRYGADGFKRLQTQGFSVENTYINHTPSKTAVGHATIFTGSVPAIHGITGNSWVERYTAKKVYCVGDTSVSSLGIENSKVKDDDGDGGQMSPKNLLVNTIADELKLATNFRSKVVGVSLKDRAAILPSGHTADGAFWYDDSSEKFISSTYYFKELPAWVKRFNDRKEPAKLMSKDWNTLYPISTYKQSSRDNAPWEGVFKVHATPTFPYPMAKIFKADKSAIRPTPFGNELTLSFAKAAIEGYKLGKGTETDFLTVNIASTDYAGHKFGSNSIEIEDVYLRLDKSLGEFLKYLDGQYGKDNYTVFLTADHGAAHSLDFLTENKMPNNNLVTSKLRKGLNDFLEKKFNTKGLVATTANYSVYFKMDKLGNLDLARVKAAAIEYLEQHEDISFAVDVDNVGALAVPEPLKSMIINGNNRKRTGHVLMVPNAGVFEASKRSGTTHGVWNPYDTHIPLLFMGWGVKQGATNKVYYQNDIAITIANLLKIQAPNGNVGKPIVELVNK